LIEEALGQLRVTLGKVLVDLNGILKLNRRLGVLALLEVPLSALEVLLFLYVRVPGTAQRKGGKTGENYNGPQG
jgi:hypothetical protein